MSENQFVNNMEKVKGIVLTGIGECFDLYMSNGSRSSKKTDRLNELIKNSIQVVIDTLHNKDEYSVVFEHNIPSENYSKQKRCDVVVMHKQSPYAVLPLKFIMTSYMKNRNNYYENMTGEVMHLRWANPTLKIVPVNIIIDKIPNLDNDKKIKNFEIIDPENSLGVYDSLVKHNIVNNIYNAVITTTHECQIGELYNKKPTINELKENLPFYDVLRTIFDQPESEN